MKDNKKLFVAGGVVLVLVAAVTSILLLGDKTYTVKFDTDGGDALESVELKEGQTLEINEIPTKEGYEFEGWLDSNDELITEDFEVTGDTTLKASWKEIGSTSNNYESADSVGTGVIVN